MNNMFTWHRLSGFLECLISNTEIQELLKRTVFCTIVACFNVETFHEFWDVFFLRLEKKRDARTAHKPSRCRGRDGWEKFARRRELRRMNTVDGECVGAPSSSVGRSSDVRNKTNKKKNHFGYLVLHPLCVFTVDSLHGSYFQLKSIYLLKRFPFETWRLNVSMDARCVLISVPLYQDGFRLKL